MKKSIILLLLISTIVFAQQKGTVTDSRDGTKYKTVKIGEQTWTAENLNYHGEDGFLGLCYGDEPQKKIRKPENCKKYGRLYDWVEAIRACPVGWHLPTRSEWRKLSDFVGGDSIVGKKLKAKNGWLDKCKWKEKDQIDNRGRTIAGKEYDKCTTDEYGFSALPGGGYSNGGFSNVGDIGYWWSSSADGGHAYYRYMDYHEDARWRDGDKSALFSVRCVQTPAKVPTENDLNLSVVISNEYLEILASGGSMPPIFYKEMWTFQCKNSKDTITYDPKTINTSNPPNCRNGKVKTINLWTLHKESEEDPGKVEMSVYSKSDSAYLDGNNDFITTLEPIKTGATVATLAESSNRKLACGQSQPGVEDICIDGKPAVKLRPRSAYDELAKTLIMIHNRFIDSPDADNITIVADDKISEKIIASVMDRAKMAGFYKINRAKTTEIYKASIAEIQKANRNNLAAYELMKDKNFAKCADSVLEKVDNLQISDCHTEDDSGGIGTEDIDMGSGDGSRSKQEIMQVVNARMPGLGNIYNKYLNLKPGFSGKVVLKFTIAPGGDIISIAIVSSTTDYFEFDNAVKNMVATWKWKVIKSGNTTITVPFNFE